MAVFVVLGLGALQIQLTNLAGSGAKFTMYDAFAPIAGAFLGSVPGLITVFLMQFFNFLIHGADILDNGTIIRFFPILFATLAFARKNILLSWGVPLVAMIAFIAHPIGQTVWYFPLLWTIPMIAYFFRDRFLLARALGATFTAHAVGGMLWIYTFHTPALVWQSLIPIVLMERFLFALGIAGSYLLINNLLYILEQKHILKWHIALDRKYLLPGLKQSSTH